MEHLAPSRLASPTVAVLTPGIYNSAYFEHSFLAQQMGVELVEGRDLVVHDGFVCMKTTAGLQRVDVIYRRIDDDFLDPQAFRPDSLLGIPGLMEVYRKGRVALANAPGTGMADDKVIYAYVEKMIQYYLDEDAIIPNVPTYVCFDEEERQVRAGESRPAGGQGGQRIGRVRHADRPARHNAGTGAVCRPDSSQNPRNYIAQPTLTLSRVPTIVGGSSGRPPRRPAALYPLRRRYLRAARRTDTRGLEERVAGRQFVAGGRQQGHLGHRRRGPAVTEADDNQQQSAGGVAC